MHPVQKTGPFRKLLTLLHSDWHRWFCTSSCPVARDASSLYQRTCLRQQEKHSPVSSVSLTAFSGTKWLSYLKTHILWRCETSLRICRRRKLWEVFSHCICSLRAWTKRERVESLLLTTDSHTVLVGMPPIGHSEGVRDADLCLPTQLISGCCTQLIGISSTASSENFSVTSCHFSSQSPQQFITFLSLLATFHLQWGQTVVLLMWTRIQIFQNNISSILCCLLCYYFFRAFGLRCKREMNFFIIIRARDSAFPFIYQMLSNMLWAIFIVLD